VKTGRLSKEEWQYIEENAEVLSVEEIANNLDRDQEPCSKNRATTDYRPNQARHSNE